MEQNYIIGEVDGFSPQIGRLVAMMNYVRSTTIAELQGLQTSELDFLHDAQSNTIGALLLHLAGVEVWYQANSFADRDLTREEELEWGAALELGDEARRSVRGHNLDYYITRLQEVRKLTLAELARRDDRWLAVRTPFWKGQEANNHFKWFHVMEDELSHRGQIRWLRKRAGGESAPF
jgi:hypothetical protein